MPKPFKISSVPYVNAAPLVHLFKQPKFAEKVEVNFAVPSLLPGLAQAKQADAILVSSIFGYSMPNVKMTGNIGIASNGPVDSVKLFSKVPFHQIQTLALDQSSMTSNCLALILLRELFVCLPISEPVVPNLKYMLIEHDAAVLIGDNGMSEKGDGLFVLDLGEAWTKMTGLPFVWAFWMGFDGLTPALVELLELPVRLLATPNSGYTMEDIIQASKEKTGWEEATLRRYLYQTIQYDLDAKDLEGYELYGRLLDKHGLLPALHIPTYVG